MAEESDDEGRLLNRAYRMGNYNKFFKIVEQGVQLELIQGTADHIRPLEKARLPPGRTTDTGIQRRSRHYPTACCEPSTPILICWARAAAIT